MSIAQPAIVPDRGAFALYVVMNVVGNKQNVIAQCQSIHQLLADLNTEQQDAKLHASVAFGKAFWESLGQQSPAELTEFRQLGEGETIAPATGGDVLLHIHSNRHDLNFYAFRVFLEKLSQDVEVLDETYGFQYLDHRDMTDFIDGTENPQTAEDRANVGVIKEGDFAGGSYVMVQRYVHNLPAWHRLNVKAQEKVIGRTKPDSIELEDVPAASHVGRVDIKEDGKGLKILRHSLPYGSVTSDHGLLFIAYCHRQHHFDAQLESMFGETDGKTDQMLRFSKPVTGAYFFAPSMAMLNSL
ncbi:Dyp-type peroxidase [Photobacterium angustum]|uniref:Deferrochelatase n=1 Tax=Photobacterium angustum TaxID=661 RepID=A0A2S7VZR0_PHOAN|nr:Dyp-type peroxidase [Photobacterium angustum]PQJ67571.1 deferrochelatase [Photobacterium angustum]